MAEETAERRRIWEIFPELAKAVRKAHEEVGLYGHHDWPHAFRVGDVARQIGNNEYGRISFIGAFAGAAGLCHNVDRILQKKLNVGRHEAPQEEVVKLLKNWLLKTDFCHPSRPGKDDLYFTEEVPTIINAILEHDGKDSPNDDQILICLKDADRVVNCRPELVMRSAQYSHERPTGDQMNFDEDPTANYRNPKTVLKDIMMSSKEWGEENSPFCVRTRLAKKLIWDEKIGIPFFQRYLELLKKSLEMEGLYPWPADLPSPMPPEKPSVV